AVRSVEGGAGARNRAHGPRNRTVGGRMTGTRLEVCGRARSARRFPEPMSTPYTFARDAYAAYGVDTEAAINQALSVPISLHCWQADDVRGLETPKGPVDGGGIMATGNHPGRARSEEHTSELQSRENLVCRRL